MSDDVSRSEGWPVGETPRPPRRRVGAIVAGSAAALLVVAAFVVTIARAGSEHTDTPTSGASTASGMPTTPAADAGDVSGSGYSFTLPAGWTDQSASVGTMAGGSAVDVLVVHGESAEVARSNVVVEALDAGDDTPDDLAGAWERKLRGADDVTVTATDGRTIDGADAVGAVIEGRSNSTGSDVVQLAFLAVHAGTQYSIVLTYAADGDETSEADFDALLSAWTWAS